MPPFGFDGKSIVEAIQKSTRDIINALKGKMKEAGGAAGVPFRERIFSPVGATGGAKAAIEGIQFKKHMEDAAKEEQALHEKRSGYYKKAGEMIGNLFFNPLKFGFTAIKSTGSKMMQTLNKKGFKKTNRFLKNMGGFLGGIVGGLGALLGFAEGLGVLQPLMDMFNAVLSLIGAGMMEELIPVFEYFGELISDPENQEMLKEIGRSIGAFLKELMLMLLQLFSDRTFWKAVTSFIGLILKVATILITAFKPILTWLGGLDVNQIKALMMALFIGWAFFHGLMMAPGWAGVAIGLALAALVGGVMGALLYMQEGGIVTKPSLAVLGEREHEIVTPVSKLPQLAESLVNYDEVVYALEDNGEKLDTLISITSRAQRLR